MEKRIKEVQGTQKDTIEQLKRDINAKIN